MDCATGLRAQRLGSTISRHYIGGQCAPAHIPKCCIWGYRNSQNLMVVGSAFEVVGVRNFINPEPCGWFCRSWFLEMFLRYIILLKGWFGSRASMYVHSFVHIIVYLKALLQCLSLYIQSPYTTGGA